VAFQTEIQFTLPKGYVEEDGTLHRNGVMRLATAADEILPLKDPRVQQNPAYLTIIVLARVITKLGSLADVNTKVIEGLFASDLNYLQKLYEELNSDEPYQVPENNRAELGKSGLQAMGFGVVGEA
jgi:hypothetical protein